MNFSRNRSTLWFLTPVPQQLIKWFCMCTFAISVVVIISMRRITRNLHRYLRSASTHTLQSDQISFYHTVGGIFERFVVLKSMHGQSQSPTELSWNDAVIFRLPFLNSSANGKPHRSSSKGNSTSTINNPSHETRQITSEFRLKRISVLGCSSLT